MPKREQGCCSTNSRARKRRIKTYRIIWRHYWDCFHNDPESEKDCGIAEAKRSILAFIRLKHIQDTDYCWMLDEEIWRLAYQYAFTLINRLDRNYRLWRKLSREERQFLDSFTLILRNLQKKRFIKNEDYSFTVGQFECVLRCMEKGEPTPLCAR